MCKLEVPEVVETREDTFGFRPRDGDRLTVTFAGAKLSIAPYTTVELDSGIYSRTLEAGDDPTEQWDRIYEFLKNSATKAAKAKIAATASMLVEGKRQAR